MKGFNAFLGMRRCKIGTMKSVPENIELSKSLLHQFPWSTDCLTFPLNSLQGALKAGSCSSTGRWQMPLWLLANALGESQLVVDRNLMNTSKAVMVDTVGAHIPWLSLPYSEGCFLRNLELCLRVLYSVALGVHSAHEQGRLEMQKH